MLVGKLVTLRARLDSDVPILHTHLYEDVSTRVRADSRAWHPIPLSSGVSYYAVQSPAADLALFSVVHNANGALAGEALLWGIDAHNRSAHVGLSLLPEYRGRGLATNVVMVLCRYGFSILGLNRLQIETLSDNAAMIAAAQKVGFVVEGTHRRASWVNGAFCDDMHLGLLASEWDPAT
jgi:RimJ/RimL family protein N-acetyltransferase